MGYFFAKIYINFVIKKIWAKIECFSDGFGYGHRGYTQFWCILTKQMAKTADLRRTIRAQVAPSAKHIKHTQKPSIRTTNSTETRLFVHFRQRYNNVIRSHATTNAFF